MASKHDAVAKRLANREGTEYNAGPGAEIQGNRRVLEVETSDTVGDAGRQLAGYKKPVYVVGTDAAATNAALEKYKGTTIGVMDSQGNIRKPSSRRSKG